MLSSTPGQGSTTVQPVPKLLDLFCGAGGAGKGYQLAGFHVTGVDIEPQPEYPFHFIQGDATELDAAWVASFDVIHASPPCQGYTPMSNRWGSSKPLLIPDVEALLVATGKPWVIENVRGAGQHFSYRHITLTGEMFGLPVHRPRLFASNVKLEQPPMPKRQRDALAVYGRKPDGRRLLTRKDGSELRAIDDVAKGARALGVDWVTRWEGVKEAIPPAYTYYVGRQLMKAIHS